MKKIILTVAVSTISTSLFAMQTIKVKDFLQQALNKNPSIENVKVTENFSKDIKNLRGWKAVNIKIQGRLKNGKSLNESSTFFTNGVFLSNGFTNMITGEQITLKPKLTQKDYKERNLISGSKTSKHKIAIFSDPMCPFCRRRVPPLIRILKRYPEKFAIYYYDFPLTQIHPASDTIVRLSELQRENASEEKKLDAVLSMYDLQINPTETDSEKIIKEYNLELNKKFTKKDLDNKKIKKYLNEDAKLINRLQLNGTPTIYFDDELDTNGDKYKKFLTN